MKDAEKDLLAQADKIDRDEVQALREEIARLDNDQSFGASEDEEDEEESDDEDEDMGDAAKGEEDDAGSSSSSSSSSSSKQTEKKKKSTKKKKKPLSLRSQLAAISREKLQISKRISKVKRNHLAAKKKLQDHAAKVDRVRQEAENLRAGVDKSAAAARMIRDDHGKGWKAMLLPGDVNARKIAAEVKQLMRKVNEAKEKHSDVDVTAVRNRCLKVKKKYKRKRAELDTINENIDTLIEMGKARKKRFKGLRNHVTKMSSLGFNSMQANFGASGSLDINHHSRSLKADVVLRDSTEAVSNAGQLSGGERSSTTLALLMSLTTAIDTPFTCMDEFDVFMDERNRKISVKTMMDHAMSSKTPDRQYIFIVSRREGGTRAECRHAPELREWRGAVKIRAGFCGLSRSSTLCFLFVVAAVVTFQVSHAVHSFVSLDSFRPGMSVFLSLSVSVCLPLSLSRTQNAHTHPKIMKSHMNFNRHQTTSLSRTSTRRERARTK